MGGVDSPCRVDLFRADPGTKSLASHSGVLCLPALCGALRREFWLERWRNQQIGFHQDAIHPSLGEHWSTLGVPAGAPVFVPLCGKSRDMLWLRAQGHAVLGVEFSEIAVRDFFAENDLEASVADDGRFKRYEADGVTLLCGDFFDLTPADLAGVAGVYDRAALIALPPDLRARYARKMRECLPERADILLVSVNYPEGEMGGPPFAVPEDEVRRLFPEDSVNLLSTADVLAKSPHLRERGLTSLKEQVFHISRTARG